MTELPFWDEKYFFKQMLFWNNAVKSAGSHYADGCRLMADVLLCDIQFCTILLNICLSANTTKA